MHKALYGRIKDELQLNIMEIGPSGLHFGLFFIRVINKIGRLTVLDKKMKIRDSSSSNKWLSSVLLLSTQEAARAIWGLWENLFWLARAIYGLWKNLQVFIYSKLHKKNDLISCNIYIYIYIYIYNQRNSQIANQTRALDIATIFENLKICERNNGRVLSRFSFATAAEKLLKQRKHCQKHCFLVAGSEKVVFREGNCKGNRKLWADPA